MRRILTLMLGASWLAGCRTQPDKDATDRLIDQRLAERGLAPLPSASVPASSASGTATASESRPDDPVATSLAFLQRAEDLMRDFRPEVPVVEDKTDLFRCITAYSAKTNADVKQALATTKADRDRARQEAERVRREFERKVAPLNYRIDYDWQTRKGQPIAATYGCYNVTYSRWTTVPTEAHCKDNPYSRGGLAEFAWKVRVEGKPAVFLYSGNDTPPSKPPALMQRLEQAAVSPPDRFACRVDDVAADTKVIKCLSPTPVVIRISGELKSINVGDLVSVPLAATKRDPDGVLLIDAQAKSRRWIIDADAAALTVDVPAQCPGIQEILAGTNDAGR